MCNIMSYGFRNAGMYILNGMSNFDRNISLVYIL